MLTKVKKKEIQNAINNKTPFIRIAEKYGISRQRVYQIKNELNRRCLICGRPRTLNENATKNMFSKFCEKHRIAHKDRNRIRYYSIK